MIPVALTYCTLHDYIAFDTDFVYWAIALIYYALILPASANILIILFRFIARKRVFLWNELLASPHTCFCLVRAEYCHTLDQTQLLVKCELRVYNQHVWKISTASSMLEFQKKRTHYTYACCNKQNVFIASDSGIALHAALLTL